MMDRAPKLQELADIIQDEFEIPADFAASSDHSYACMCNACLRWWVSMGPEENGKYYGRYTPDEFAAVCAQFGVEFRKKGGQ